MTTTFDPQIVYSTAGWGDAMAKDDTWDWDIIIEGAASVLSLKS